VKWAFIAFNLLMLWWIVSYLSTVSEMKVHSSAEHAGKVIGSALGVGSLLMLWAIGDFIIGLLVFFSRGNKVVTEEILGGLPADHTNAGSTSAFDRADDLIAQYKADLHVHRGPPSPPQATTSSGFGKRRSM
jgi:hypothetical protein